MIWFITLAVLAALLFVMFYKKPINRVHVPLPPSQPEAPSAQAPQAPFDLNDLYGKGKPGDQPRA
jgi:hypothetical protein